MFLVKLKKKNLAAEGAEVGEKSMNWIAMTSVKPKMESPAGSSLSCSLIFPGIFQNIAEEQEQNTAKSCPTLLNQWLSDLKKKKRQHNQTPSANTLVVPFSSEESEAVG